MANLLNGFLDNLVTGIKPQTVILVDKQHAARLYVDDSSDYHPK